MRQKPKTIEIRGQMQKKIFFCLVPKSPTRMGSLSAKNASKIFSRLGTFNKSSPDRHYEILSRIWPTTKHIPASPTYQNSPQHTTPYSTYPLQIDIMKSCPAYDLQLNISLPVLHIKTSPNILHLMQHILSRTPSWSPAQHMTYNTTYPCLYDISNFLFTYSTLHIISYPERHNGTLPSISFPSHPCSLIYQASILSNLSNAERHINHCPAYDFHLKVYHCQADISHFTRHNSPCLSCPIQNDILKPCPACDLLYPRYRCLWSTYSIPLCLIYKISYPVPVNQCCGSGSGSAWIRIKYIPDPHPYQHRIRIKVISWIRNRILIRINLQMASQNVWNMSLFECFSNGSSLYLEARI